MDLLNKKVKHSKYGVGIVTVQDEERITVAFPGKTTKFPYPQAFEQYLVPEDAVVLETIKSEITAKKAAEEAEKLAEEAEKAAQEQAKLEELKQRASAGGKKNSSNSKAYVPVVRTPGQAMTFFVFQNSTFAEESEDQFLWAPKYSKGGGTFHHWDSLMNVREGDVILHSNNGCIKAISRAKGACEECTRPGEDTSKVDWTQWSKEGRKVSCEYHLLDNPLKHGDYKEEILKYSGVKYAPFDRDGNGNMGYLFDLNKDLAAFFVQKIAKNNPEVIDLDYLKFLLVK